MRHPVHRKKQMVNLDILTPRTKDFLKIFYCSTLTIQRRSSNEKSHTCTAVQKFSTRTFSSHQNVVEAGPPSNSLYGSSGLFKKPKEQYHVIPRQFCLHQAASKGKKATLEVQV